MLNMAKSECIYIKKMRVIRDVIVPLFEICNKNQKMYFATKLINQLKHRTI